MTTAKEVTRAAYLFSLSALRALPASLAENLDQSSALDAKLKTIEVNFDTQIDDTDGNTK
ncbi:hypothetical protein EDF68_104144 [Ochrobactrum sp. BH3]|nr:hypothetical protein EDF68_104144 [Ochrobactrum sp. BH3]